MTDIVEQSIRRRMMAGIRRKDTKPELVVRRCLISAGIRYRLHQKDLPGKPDIVMPGRHVAIFVHGCFWHQHDGCRFVKLPSTNSDFWTTKLRKNVERDYNAVSALLKAGWRVLSIWECATRRGQDIKLCELLIAWLKGDERNSQLPESAR